MFDQTKSKKKQLGVAGEKRKRKLRTSHRGIVDVNSPPPGRRKTRVKKK